VEIKVCIGHQRVMNPWNYGWIDGASIGHCLEEQDQH